MREFFGVAYLLLPLLFGGIFLGICIKYNWFSFLVFPIDKGWMVRGRPLFGRNKTYRGLVTVAFGSAITLGLQSMLFHDVPCIRDIELFDYSGINAWLLGALAGLVSMLGELPNSFVKRRMGVKPGEGVKGVLAPIFYFLDQVDFLIGAWPVFAIAVDVTLVRVLISIAIVMVVHPLTALIGHALGMRKTRR